MNHPNIILLVLDAVRADTLSAYGYPVRTTPHLDAFAAENIFFKRAYTSSTWTVPTHASMLTGLYLSQHRLENVNADRAFNEAIVTLPQALRANHYHTAAFSQNFLFDPQHYLADCFDEFFPLWDTSRRRRGADGSAYSQGKLNKLERQWQTLNRYWEKQRGLRRTLDHLYEWLSAQDDETPIFTMVNLTTAHYPWAPAPGILWQRLGWDLRHFNNQDFVKLNPYRFNSGKQEVSDKHREIWLALYEAAIIHLDRELGRFLNQLRRWPKWSNSVVIITSDHGELLGDYRDIVGHTLNLNDRLLHVPLFVHHPDYTGGNTIEGVVQNMDLYVSILEWAGLLDDRIPTAQKQRPPLSVAVAQPEYRGGLAFAEEDYTDSYDPIRGLLKVNPKMDPHKYPRQQIAVHSATHKYIWFDDRQAEFYDLTVDPAEANNLINTDLAEERSHLYTLQNALATWRANLDMFPPRSINGATAPNPQMIKHLQALGYMA